ncbi:hypothetical protein [Microbacterium sp. 2FI]|nr:hypothetical protein [Microbacterium sp. 2FI]
MLDVLYLVAVIALFALVGLVAKGVERLDLPARGSAQRDAMRGREQR